MPALPRIDVSLGLAAGVCWLAFAAPLGVVSFLLAVVPGVLLTAGSGAAWVAPGPRPRQIAALGGAIGVPLALFFVFTAGLGLAGVLAAASAAAFVAAGWSSQSDEPAIEGVPPPDLSLVLAAKVALDEALLATLVARRGEPSIAESERLAGEVERGRELFRERGWLDKPATYHREPPPLVDPRIVTRRSLGTRFEHLSFDSGYEPDADEPGRDRWLGHLGTRTAHAWMLRHRDGEERPWLVCIHGYRMGTPPVDLGAFRAQALHRDVGVNVLLPVLPLHGPRRVGRRSGDGFLDGELLDTIHAEAQAMWDLRRLLGWIRSRGATSIGVYGLSLGGYNAALLGGLDGDLACLIAGIPATDFARAAERHRSAEEQAGTPYSPEAMSELLRVVSPLALEPRLPHDRRYIFGGTADRLVPPDQVRDLWRHWGEPRLAWYEGSHMSIAWERDVRRLLDEAFSHLAF